MYEMAVMFWGSVAGVGFGAAAFAAVVSAVRSASERARFADVAPCSADTQHWVPVA